MANESQWFYVNGSEREGPLTTSAMDALRIAGTIGEETLVWTEGMEGWAPLSQTSLHKGPVTPPGVPPRFDETGPSAAEPEAPVTSLGEAIRVCFQKYVTFSGRANRPEFWWFALFWLLGGVAVAIVDGMIFGSSDYGVLQSLFSLVLLLPGLAVCVRRLHDTDRSGWWYLLTLIPLVGIIILIIWWSQRGTPGRNRFG